MNKLEEYELLSKNKYGNYVRFIAFIGLIFYHPIWLVVALVVLLFLAMNRNSKLDTFLKVNINSSDDYEAYSILFVLKCIVFWILYLIFVCYKLNVLACILVLVNAFVQIIIDNCISDLIKKDLKNGSKD